MHGHLLVLLALPALIAAAPAVEKPPNVIIFLADDLGYGDLGCFGHPRITTPNLDAFARQGVRLTQCYAASAVCSPSRSAILTGRTPHRNGVYTWIAEGSEVHLPASESQHHGNVTQLDHAFGELMKALGEQGLANTTLVVFTSDNGPEGDGTEGRTRGSAGGLRGRKRTLYEGGIRVPGIVRWPGRIPPGVTVNVPVIGSDLFPTILAIAGVKPPADRVIDGVNVLPELTGQAATVARKIPLYWRLNMAPAEENLQMALRVGDWKLLASLDFSHVELYNLKADPEEKRDLATKEAQRMGAMRATLEKQNAEIEREGPDWWKRLSPNGGGPIKRQ